MTPRYGRCEIGKRLIGYAPFGHWKTTTFLAALRHDGLTAPCVFDGAINGEKFAAYTICYIPLTSNRNWSGR